MYLLITQRKYKKKIYKHGKIAEWYRENGKIKHKIIKNLGSLKTKEDEIRVRNLLKNMKRGNRLISVNEIIHDKVREYGAIHTSQELWKKIGLTDVVEETFRKMKIGFNIFDSILMLTVSRFYNPSSDLDTFDWIRNHAYYPNNIQLHHFYKTLDLIASHKDELEEKIFERLKKNGIKADIVFYDLTSTYFEGRGPDNAKHGYSRDHRRDRKQVVLGLVLCDGYPITHRIWSGNTLDRDTLKEAVKYLKQTFKINKTIFVADRGLIIEANLEDLEGSEYDYILATKRRRDNFVKELIIQDIQEKAKIVKKVKVKDKTRRYILCFNKETQESEKRRLKKIREESTKKLEEIKRIVNGKKRKSIDNIVKKELKSKSKFFRWSFKNKVFAYSLNKDAWDYENAIAGKFLLVTTSDLKPEDVMKSYKDLKYIEQTFRELKDIIEIRPVYHQKNARVEGHVFICVLSLLTRRLMSKNLAETNEIIKELSEIKAIETTIGEEKYYFLTRLTKKQEEISKRLNIEFQTTL